MDVDDAFVPKDLDNNDDYDDCDLIKALEHDDDEVTSNPNNKSNRNCPNSYYSTDSPQQSPSKDLFSAARREKKTFQPMIWEDGLQKRKKYEGLQTIFLDGVCKAFGRGRWLKIRQLATTR